MSYSAASHPTDNGYGAGPTLPSLPSADHHSNSGGDNNGTAGAFGSVAPPAHSFAPPPPPDLAYLLHPQHHPHEGPALPTADGGAGLGMQPPPPPNHLYDTFTSPMAAPTAALSHHHAEGLMSPPAAVQPPTPAQPPLRTHPHLYVPMSPSYPGLAQAAPPQHHHHLYHPQPQSAYPLASLERATGLDAGASQPVMGSADPQHQVFDMLYGGEGLVSGGGGGTDHVQSYVHQVDPFPYLQAQHFQLLASMAPPAEDFAPPPSEAAQQALQPPPLAAGTVLGEAAPSPWVSGGVVGGAYANGTAAHAGGGIHPGAPYSVERSLSFSGFLMRPPTAPPPPPASAPPTLLSQEASFASGGYGGGIGGGGSSGSLAAVARTATPAAVLPPLVPTPPSHPQPLVDLRLPALGSHGHAGGGGGGGFEMYGNGPSHHMEMHPEACTPTLLASHASPFAIFSPAGGYAPPPQQQQLPMQLQYGPMLPGAVAVPSHPSQAATAAAGGGFPGGVADPLLSHQEPQTLPPPVDAMAAALPPSSADNGGGGDVYGNGSDGGGGVSPLAGYHLEGHAGGEYDMGAGAGPTGLAGSPRPASTPQAAMAFLRQVLDDGGDLGAHDERLHDLLPPEEALDTAATTTTATVAAGGAAEAAADAGAVGRGAGGGEHGSDGGMSEGGGDAGGGVGGGGGCRGEHLGGAAGGDRGGAVGAVGEEADSSAELDLLLLHRAATAAAAAVGRNGARGAAYAAADPPLSPVDLDPEFDFHQQLQQHQELLLQQRQQQQEQHFLQQQQHCDYHNGDLEEPGGHRHHHQREHEHGGDLHGIDDMHPDLHPPEDEDPNHPFHHPAFQVKLEEEQAGLPHPHTHDPPHAALSLGGDFQFPPYDEHHGTGTALPYGGAGAGGVSNGGSGGTDSLGGPQHQPPLDMGRGGGGGDGDGDGGGGNGDEGHVERQGSSTAAAERWMDAAAAAAAAAVSAAGVSEHPPATAAAVEGFEQQQQRPQQQQQQVPSTRVKAEPAEVEEVVGLLAAPSDEKHRQVAATAAAEQHPSDEHVWVAAAPQPLPPLNVPAHSNEAAAATVAERYGGGGGGGGEHHGGGGDDGDDDVDGGNEDDDHDYEATVRLSGRRRRPSASPPTPSAAAAARSAGGAAAAVSPGGFHPAWLVVLTTDPRFFQPCPRCNPLHPGSRDALMTYLDVSEPHSPGVCGYCRAARVKEGHRLLQVRRSTYHEVVQVADVAGLLDLEGVQLYTINHARVVFLRSRPQARAPKGAAMPSRCLLDGRQLMDAAARYCSLRCKIENEPDRIMLDPSSAAAAAVLAHIDAVRANGEAAAAARPAAGGSASPPPLSGRPTPAHARGGAPRWPSAMATAAAAPSLPYSLPRAPPLSLLPSPPPLGADYGSPAAEATGGGGKRRRIQSRQAGGGELGTAAEAAEELTGVMPVGGFGGDGGGGAVTGSGQVISLAPHRTTGPSSSLRRAEARRARQQQLQRHLPYGADVADVAEAEAAAEAAPPPALPPLPYIRQRAALGGGFRADGPLRGRGPGPPSLSERAAAAAAGGRWASGGGGEGWMSPAEEAAAEAELLSGHLPFGYDGIDGDGRRRRQRLEPGTDVGDAIIPMDVDQEGQRLTAGEEGGAAALHRGAPAGSSSGGMGGYGSDGAEGPHPLAGPPPPPPRSRTPVGVYDSAGGAADLLFLGSSGGAAAAATPAGGRSPRAAVSPRRPSLQRRQPTPTPAAGSPPLPLSKSPGRHARFGPAPATALGGLSKLPEELPQQQYATTALLPSAPSPLGAAASSATATAGEVRHGLRTRSPRTLSRVREAGENQGGAAAAWAAALPSSSFVGGGGGGPAADALALLAAGRQDSVNGGGGGGGEGLPVPEDLAAARRSEQMAAALAAMSPAAPSPSRAAHSGRGGRPGSSGSLGSFGGGGGYSLLGHLPPLPGLEPDFLSGWGALMRPHLPLQLAHPYPHYQPAHLQPLPPHHHHAATAAVLTLPPQGGEELAAGTPPPPPLMYDMGGGAAATGGPRVSPRRSPGLAAAVPPRSPGGGGGRAGSRAASSAHSFDSGDTPSTGSQLHPLLHHHHKRKGAPHRSALE